MASPLPTLALTLVYLFIVLVGPRFHRRPIECRSAMVLYNFAMMALNAYIFQRVKFALLL